jgi:hypothetical protein
MLHVPEGFLGNSGIVRLVERTWAIEHMKGLLDCGHMHGQHAATDSTQGENLVGK